MEVLDIHQVVQGEGGLEQGEGLQVLQERIGQAREAQGVLGQLQVPLFTMLQEVAGERILPALEEQGGVQLEVRAGVLRLPLLLPQDMVREAEAVHLVRVALHHRVETDQLV